VGVVALLLGAVAAVVYGPNAIQGGFVSDAWGIRAAYEALPNSGFLTGVDYFLERPNVIPRPLQAVYFAGQNALFGSHMTLWLGWQVVLSVLMSTSLYVLLRQLRFWRIDAGAMATMVLLFPAATSIRLWIAPLSALTISFALIGFVLALRAFQSSGRRRLVLHGLSLAMLVASLLVYELMLPIMLASVLVYRLRVPWRDAVRRWLVDCAVLAPLVLTVTRSESSSWEVQSTPAMWDHLVLIWEQSRTLFATVVLPFDVDEWLALAFVAVVPAVSLLVLRRLDSADPARAELRRWLVTGAAGLAVVALGYAIYVPAMDYYAPLGQGIGNRVNAVPSLGWVLMLYGLVMLVATLAVRRLARARTAASALALIACVVVGVGWLQSVSRDSNSFIEAYEEGQRVLRAVGDAVPAPPPSSTIWTFGQPVEIAPGVPVFGNTWDMTGSVQLMYGDPSLVSYVAFPDTTFDCRAAGLVPGGRYAADGLPSDAYASRYGLTYFVDTVSGRLERIDSRSQCERAVAEFPHASVYPN
jgi:hypothetical protein